VTAEEIARLLDAKKTSTGWIARCPAHDDRQPSLSIRTGDNGRELLRCHAGCTYDEIRAAMSQKAADLQPIRNLSSPRRIIATYDYTDEGRRLVCQTVRTEPKGFWQRRPDSVGGWIGNLDGVPRVLFKLPDLKGHETVWVVEGEKDALRLWDNGFAATTNIGGAGKWRDEYARQLVNGGTGAVVVLPDNDDAGRRHVDGVALSCHAAGLRAKIVTLPGLPPKGDISDWFAAGHSREELLALVEQTSAYVPGAGNILNAHAQTGAQNGGAPNARPQPVIVRLSDVQSEAVSWLWPGRLAVGKLTLLVGDPGLGKSWVTLDIAARLSAGRAWPDGALAVPPQSVLLVSAEDGLADTVRPRLDALGADPSRVHHLNGVREGDRERAVQLADTSAFESAIEQTGARAVIVDPVSAYLGKTDSHRDSDVRGLLAPLAAIAERRGVALLGVMHLSKGTQRPAIYRTIGSIAFTAAARIVIAVAADPEDNRRRIVAPIKSNVSAPPPALAFSLQMGQLVWEPDPVSDADVNRLLSGSTAGTKAKNAHPVDAWLRDALADGPVAMRDLERQAEALGISWRTVERAKERLDLNVKPLGFRGPWYWSLNETATSDQLAVSADQQQAQTELSPCLPETATTRDVAVSADQQTTRTEFQPCCPETGTTHDVAVSADQQPTCSEFPPCSPEAATTDGVAASAQDQARDESEPNRPETATLDVAVSAEESHDGWF
jgi:hypothetical protein